MSNSKKLLTLDEIKKDTKEGLNVRIVFFIIVGIGILALGGFLLFGGIKDKRISGMLIAVVVILFGVVFICSAAIFIKARRKLPKSGDWQIQIEIRKVLGKYDIFQDDPDAPHYEDYIAVEPGVLSREHRYKCEGKKEFAMVNAGDLAYVVKVEGNIQYFFSSMVELDSSLQPYIIESRPHSEQEMEDFLRGHADTFRCSCNNLRCLNCGKIVNFAKYQKECKFCKQPMGYTEEVFMDLVRKGTAINHGQPGIQYGSKKKKV